MTTCRWCWLGHGCDLAEGHDGDHQCLWRPIDGDEQICDSRPRGHPDVFDCRTDEPEIIES